MLNWFKFGDVDSRDFSAEVFWKEIDTAPSRSYNKQVVPGRNGNFFIDNGRHENIDISYSIITLNEENMNDIRDAMLSQIGYKRLEDSFHDAEFYKAVFNQNINPETTKERDFFKAEITFNRQPERFLKSGENAVILNGNGSIENYTRHDAKPLIRAYGEGILKIGTYQLEITSADEYTDIDCDIMECYKGVESKNEYVELVNHSFPVLIPGVNNIQLSGITKIEITPRWYKL